MTTIKHRKDYIKIDWDKEWLEGDISNDELLSLGHGIINDVATMMDADPKSLCIALAATFGGNPTMRASDSEETAKDNNDDES